MRRKRFKIRLGLALAVAVAALSVASSAQAMPAYDGDGGSTSVQPRVVVASSGGFDWGYAEIGAGVALAAALVGIGTVRYTRNHDQLAGQH